MRFDRVAATDNTTACRIVVKRINPNNDSAQEPGGCPTETTLFVVMTGAETLVSHDSDEITRQMPGDARRMLHELRVLDGQVNGVSA